MRKLALVGIAIGLLCLPQAVPAQQMDALLKKLVSKGVLSKQEAEDVEAEMQEEEHKEGKEKARVSELAEKLTLFGDLRLRYEYRDVQNGFDNFDDGVVEPDGADSRDDVSRFRYRLRVGARVAFRDDLEFGFRLASGNEAEEVTSTNTTFGDAFGKDGVYIDQVYLRWNGLGGLTLMAGKFDMPMWTTEMFWDHDVTPEGGFEQYIWKAGKWEFTLNAAQFVFADVSEADEDITDTGGSHPDNLADDGSRAVVNDDGWIFAGQAIARFEWVPKKSDGRVGVSYWYFANAEDLSGGAIGSDGYPSDTGQRTRATGVVYTAPGTGNNLGREFQLLDCLFEWNFRGLPGLPENFAVRPFAHLIWNLAPAPNTGIFVGRRDDGSTVDRAGNPDDIDEAGEFGVDDADGWRDISEMFAWRAGMEIGTGTKKKGGWSLMGYYEEVGSDAVPDAFNESDIANSFTNHKAFVAKASYAIRDWWQVTLCWLDSDVLDADLMQDENLNFTPQCRTIQVDTVVKF